MANFVLGSDMTSPTPSSDKADDSMEGFIADDDVILRPTIVGVRTAPSSPGIVHRQHSLPFMRFDGRPEYHGVMAPPARERARGAAAAVAGGVGDPKPRHYKKDSRYLLDLYTLTFDEDETVDEIEVISTNNIRISIKMTPKIYSCHFPALPDHGHDGDQ